jgi:uncharacterized protein YbjT (DUF2867 family)
MVSCMMQPNGQTVLVIGATGKHGNTGAVVVDRLISQGSNVRVLIRTDGERVEALRQMGATPVTGDLHDRSTLSAAIQGASAVYFTYPIAAGVIPAAANLASVLVESGQRPHLVVMSMATSSHNHPSKLGRDRAVAEEIFTWAGLNPTILRVAALFHENVLILHAESIRNDGVIANSFGSAKVPWIGGRDAAELAVHHLLQPPPSAPQVSYPAGAEALSHAEIADIISVETGQKIQYRSISQQQWRGIIEAGSDNDGPVNTAMAPYISIVGAGFAAGKAPLVSANPDTLAAILGHQPATFTEFVREHRDDFALEAAKSTSVR